MLCSMGSIPIQRFKLQNFKSIGPTGVDLEFAPLTILIGPNGAGKTSILEAIGVVVQSANQPDRSGLDVDGKLMRVESESLLFHNGAEHDMRFEFLFSVEALQLQSAVQYGDAKTLGYQLAYGPKGGVENGSYSSRRVQQVLSLDGVDKVRVEQTEKQRSYELLESRFPLAGLPADADRILGETAFGQPTFTADKNPSNEVYHYVYATGNLVQVLARVLNQSTTLLSSTRGADLYVQNIGDVSLTTGRFGEGTVRVLSALQADVTRSESFNSIREWAAKFGLPSLTGGWIGRDELRLQYLDPNTKTALPISMAGAGSKHILPFIVECFVSPKPRLIMVDEPEQGLHPAFQLVLAELLAKSIERGNQLILCTQSPTLVLAVCALVAAKTIAREAVAVYSLERDGDETKASRNAISASGAIEGGWFQHFAKAERELLEKFLPGEEDAAAP
jgi:predicted ATPase